MGSMCLGFIGDKALIKYSKNKKEEFFEAVRELVQQDKHTSLNINKQLDELEMFTDDDGTTSVFMTFNENPLNTPKGLTWPETIYRMIDNLKSGRIEVHEDFTYEDDCGNKRRSVHIEGWPD